MLGLIDVHVSNASSSLIRQTISQFFVESPLQIGELRRAPSCAPWTVSAFSLASDRRFILWCTSCPCLGRSPPFVLQVTEEIRPPMHILGPAKGPKFSLASDKVLALFPPSTGGNKPCFVSLPPWGFSKKSSRRSDPYSFVNSYAGFALSTCGSNPHNKFLHYRPWQSS